MGAGGQVARTVAAVTDPTDPQPELGLTPEPQTAPAVGDPSDADPVDDWADDDALDVGVVPSGETPASAPAMHLVKVGALVGVPVWVCLDDPTMLPCADALGELLVLGDHTGGAWRPATVYPSAVAAVFFRDYAERLAAADPVLRAAADHAGVTDDLLLVLADVCDEVVEASTPIDFTTWSAAQWVEFSTRAQVNVTGARFWPPAADPAAVDGWSDAADALEDWVACVLGELVVVSAPYLLTRLPGFTRVHVQQLLAAVSGLVAQYPTYAAVATLTGGYRPAE